MHEDTSNEGAAALRRIIEDIVLTPENGRLGIVVKGELARLLAATVPADQAEEFERVKMVAGACNQLDLEFPWSVVKLPAAS